MSTQSTGSCNAVISDSLIDDNLIGFAKPTKCNNGACGFNAAWMARCKEADYVGRTSKKFENSNNCAIDFHILRHATKRLKIVGCLNEEGRLSTAGLQEHRDTASGGSTDPLFVSPRDSSDSHHNMKDQIVQPPYCVEAGKSSGSEKAPGTPNTSRDDFAKMKEIIDARSDTALNKTCYIEKWIHGL